MNFGVRVDEVRKKSSQLASDARKIKAEVEEYESDLEDVADLFKLVF